jgi:hypothetical protein
MSLNEIKKEFQIAGKGHNVALAIVIPLAHMRFLTENVDGHVPENGGTCHFGSLCKLVSCVTLSSEKSQ